MTSLRRPQSCNNIVTNFFVSFSCVRADTGNRSSSNHRYKLRSPGHRLFGHTYGCFSKLWTSQVKRTSQSPTVCFRSCFWTPPHWSSAGAEMPKPVHPEEPWSERPRGRCSYRPLKEEEEEEEGFKQKTRGGRILFCWGRCRPVAPRG